MVDDAKLTAENREELLLRLAAAEEAYRPKRERFMVVQAMGMQGVEVFHPALPNGLVVRSLADLEDLADEGLLRPSYGERGMSGFDMTPAGLDQARLLRLAATAESPEAGKTSGALEWQDRVLPVLEAIGRIYGRATPELGLSIDALANEVGVEVTDADLGRIVYELVQTGYLRATVGTDQMLAPVHFRLEEKGLKVVAGWPTDAGPDLLARLLVLIDERIASAQSDAERSKWERFRDGLVGVGRDVASEVLAALATGAVRGLT